MIYSYYFDEDLAPKENNIWVYNISCTSYYITTSAGKPDSCCPWMTICSYSQGPVKKFYLYFFIGFIKLFYYLSTSLCIEIHQTWCSIQSISSRLLFFLGSSFWSGSYQKMKYKVINIRFHITKFIWGHISCMHFQIDFLAWDIFGSLLCVILWAICFNFRQLEIYCSVLLLHLIPILVLIYFDLTIFSDQCNHRCLYMSCMLLLIFFFFPVLCLCIMS